MSPMTAAEKGDMFRAPIQSQLILFLIDEAGEEVEFPSPLFSSLRFSSRLGSGVEC